MSTLKALFHMQAGECFYCGQPTWLCASGENMRSAQQRLGLKSKKEVRRREASREHLKRRAEGGRNRMENYVLACVECNTSRGDKPVLIHFAEKRGRKDMLAVPKPMEGRP